MAKRKMLGEALVTVLSRMRYSDVDLLPPSTLTGGGLFALITGRSPPSVEGTRAAQGVRMSDVTVLLRKLAADDPAAIGQLFELLYSDLHRMARARLAHNGSITLLDTTGLAHEAFLRLREAGRIDLDSRGRFMAYVSKVLRSVIVDFARKRNADRRGGDQVHVTLNTEIAEEAVRQSTTSSASTMR